MHPEGGEYLPMGRGGEHRLKESDEHPHSSVF